MTVSVDTTKTGDQGSLFSTLAIQAGGVLAMAVGSTFNLYNTEDQTTNHERLRADWSGNVARIYTQAAGTGTVRGMSIATGTYAGTSGTTTALTVNPTINQSDTAGYTALDINPTESATGSGTKLLQRWAVGGSAVGQLASTGGFWANALFSVGTVQFSTALGVGGDIILNRDTADTLALRRLTHAQTFRVYNTYTDASNYRRWNLSWNTTTAIMQVVGAGTGTNGNLAVGNAALATNATVGYFMIPSSAGAPTGVPADIPTGQVALHFDSTNNKLYVYDGGWLSTAALT